MFKFLKEKIKGALASFSKKAEEEAEEVIEEVKSVEKIDEELEEISEELEKEERLEKEKEDREKAEDIEEVKEELEEISGELEKDDDKDELIEEVEKVIKVEREVTKELEKELKEVKKQESPRKTLFGRIKEKVTTKKISGKKFDELFWDLELVLLENNVAVEVIEKIKDDLKEELVDKPIPRGKIESTIVNSLRKSIDGLFIVYKQDLVEIARKKKPFVICFVGINGSGKTTSIAKVAKLFKDNGMSVVLAAGDTFRAAAIDQLQLHADKLDVKLIKHDYGSDAAAVAFDAVKHAESTNKDVVLIDTAGRLHSNTNLMEELSKIVRVSKPDMKIFVGESITGNDCVEQAKKFDEAVGIDGIILSKADIDEKGGASISISYVTKKPVFYIGTGQEYGDLQRFDKDIVLEGLGL